MFTLESKCANSACATRFDPRQGGKFFRFQSGPDRGTGDGESWAPRLAHHHVEHFWLCAHCSEAFRLAYTPEHGVVLLAGHAAYSPAPEEELNVA
jgi:hypothetical protein